MKKAFIALAGILAIPATIAFNHVMGMKNHGENITEEMQGQPKVSIQSQPPTHSTVSKELQPYKEPEEIAPL